MLVKPKPGLLVVTQVSPESAEVQNWPLRLREFRPAIIHLPSADEATPVHASPGALVGRQVAPELVET